MFILWEWQRTSEHAKFYGLFRFDQNVRVGFSPRFVVCRLFLNRKTNDAEIKTPKHNHSTDKLAGCSKLMPFQIVYAHRIWPNAFELTVTHTQRTN